MKAIAAGQSVVNQELIIFRLYYFVFLIGILVVLAAVFRSAENENGPSALRPMLTELKN